MTRIKRWLRYTANGALAIGLIIQIIGLIVLVFFAYLYERFWAYVPYRK